MDRTEASPRAKGDVVEVWPHLVFRELIAMLVVGAGLLVVSLLVEAPLEEMADPAYTPSVAKAPWYFVGLQELLVYFDPWVAGVVVPAIIIVGLMSIPYVDRSPTNVGVYSFRKRPLAWSAFVFGLATWFALIAIGEFTRGPHWAWYWPGESWDMLKAAPPASMNLPLPLGITAVVGWFALGIGFPAWLCSSFRLRLGWPRFVLFMTLLLGMLAVPAKIVLRLAFNIHYVVTTPWFNI